MWWSGVWNGFLLGQAKKDDVFPVSFVAKKMEVVIGFGCVLSTSLQHVRDLPEFASLMSLDRSNWPRCVLWHGWLPGLNDIGGNDPWAVSFGDLASVKLERCLGAYPVAFAGSWTPPKHWDADDIDLEMSDHPSIWTDGSREDFSSQGVLKWLVLVLVFVYLLLRLLLIL